MIERIAGDTEADEEYEAMVDWIQGNGLSSDANYQQVQAWVDVTNYTDYIIAETFFANVDWPMNNCDFWRAHTNQAASCGSYGDTRWRWMLYDLDLAGGNGADFDMLAYLASNNMTGGSEPGFLVNALWSNMDYRNRFVTRYVNVLNTSLRPDRTARVIVQASDAIAPEIEAHFRRWGRSCTQAQWRQAVSQALVQFTATRHALTWTHLDRHFGLGGTGVLTVRNHREDGVGGRFKVNGVDIDATTDGVTNRATWSGTFFQSLAVPVQAVPDPTYVFDGWVGTALTNEARSIFVGSVPQVTVARFRLSSAPPYAPSGYENWQMANYSEQEILSGEASPAVPSGCAGMSNFELYVFGMHRFDGFTDAQRRARASLSVRSLDGRLRVGYARLNDHFTDVRYSLKVARSLIPPVAWTGALSGVDFDAPGVTNILDPSTWFCEYPLITVPDSRFFRLEAGTATNAPY